MSKQNIRAVQLAGFPKPSRAVFSAVAQLTKKVPLHEYGLGLPILLWYDERSEAYYTICHVNAEMLASSADLEAVLDPQESEDYKLNREIYTDNYAYRRMEADAKLGRSFEDIVVEFDESYRPKTPLKIYGGQHRIEAIKMAVAEKGTRLHGVRIYFDLTVEQKVDIATANNTSIAVSNDLLDRMQEELLGSELRDWAQATGLLGPDQGFADKRNSAGVPTVRIARTIVLNFYRGMGSSSVSVPDPYVCRSGPSTDTEYENLWPKIKWTGSALLRAGKEFASLHAAQRNRVLNRENDSYLEFANKCMHPSVAAAWGYVAGMLQKMPELENHYGLSSSTKIDPLNAAALLKARLPAVDPDTYRGLGARINSNEVGRVVQVFLLQATKATKRGISLQLANAAIKRFEALRATAEADKATSRI